MSDDIDHRGLQPDRQRFHLVQRPLVGLVVLASGRKDGQFREPTADNRVPADVHTRSMQPNRRDALWPPRR